jgi:hypothetical protein
LGQETSNNIFTNDDLQIDPFLRQHKSNIIAQKVISQFDRSELNSDVGKYLLLTMSYQHQSRDRIKEILKAAKKPMTPKEVYNAAKNASMNMNYAAIRKLLRDMMRIDVRCSSKGQYCLIDDLSEKQINAAPAKEFYEGLVALIESHRRQRHTTGADFIRGLEKALNEERAKSKSKQRSKSESHSEIESAGEN